MASYTLIGSASIVQVLSPTVTADMVAATIQTQPTGVTATLLVSQTAFDSGQAASALGSFADAIEALIAQGKAVGGSGTSSLDASGLQQYAVTFEVGYNPPGAPAGTVTADVDVPVGLLSQEDALIGRTLFAQAVALVDATYASLVAMSGGAPVAASVAASTGTVSEPAATTA